MNVLSDPKKDIFGYTLLHRRIHIDRCQFPYQVYIMACLKRCNLHIKVFKLNFAGKYSCI